MTETIIALAAVILIPLLPAYLLYKTLPATAVVQGPFKGLNVNLQGAFGGYFVLVLLAFAVAQAFQPEDTYPRYEEYELLGSVTLDGQNDQQLDPRLFEMFMHPRVERVEGPIGRNNFEWATTLPLSRGDDGSLSWPYERLLIEYPGFYTQQLNLRSGEVQPDGKITFDPIKLEPKPMEARPVQEVELTNDP